MKRKAKIKKVSTRPIGKLIKKTIKDLRGVRPKVSASSKKRIDLNIKTLQSCYTQIQRACIGMWIP